MPWTSNPAIRHHNAKLQRRPIVRAPRAQRVDLAIVFHNENLSILYTLDLAFDFVKRFDIRQGSQTDELVFLGHGGKGASLGIRAGGWC